MAMEIGKYNIESNLKYSSDEGLEEVNESIISASTGKNSSKENDHGKGGVHFVQIFLNFHWGSIATHH